MRRFPHPLMKIDVNWCSPQRIFLISLSISIPMILRNRGGDPLSCCWYEKGEKENAKTQFSHKKKNHHHPTYPAEAGVDVIDTAIDCFSGMTSQPSMGAVVNALAASPAATGLDPRAICDLNEYWGEVFSVFFFFFFFFFQELNPCFCRFDNCMSHLKVE